MSTVINTNLASLFAQNSLSNAQNNLATSVQRLSSGLRINSAKDDAAGLAISQNMQSQLNGTNQSIQNLNNATNLLQTADSSLSTIQDMLLRMKQLSTQGYDGSLNATQMQDVVQQMSQLNSEINATASRTQFNGINLIGTGSFVNNKTSGVYAGQYLVNTEPSVKSTDTNTTTQASNVMGSSGKLFLSGSGSSATASYTLQFDANVDPALKRQNPGNYKLSTIGDTVTLDYTAQDGSTKQQSIKLSAAPADSNGNGSNSPTTYNLAFNQFGLSLNLSVTPAASSGPSVLATDVAAGLNQRTFEIAGQASQLTDVQLTGAVSGKYTLTQGVAGTAPTVAFTAGTAASGNTAAVPSTEDVTFADISSGDKVVVGGLTFTATADTAATSLATQFKDYLASGTAGTSGNFSGSIASTWDPQATGSAATATSAAGVLTLTANDETGTKQAASLTTNNDKLTLSWSTYDASGKSSPHSQTITLLDANFKSGTDSAINFSAAGVQLKIHNFQDQTGVQIAGELSNLVGNNNTISGNVTLSQSNPGVLDVVNPGTTALNFQSGPSSSSFVTINTLNVMTDTTGQYTGSNITMTGVGVSMTTLQGYNGSTKTTDWQSAFQNASAAIDGAIDYISTQRSVFGSQMNRLSYINSNLTAQSTNLQSSRSAIIDTNFASETATLTKGQIMQQAATAMLAQANQMPNVILSLLK